MKRDWMQILRGLLTLCALLAGASFAEAQVAGGTASLSVSAASANVALAANTSTYPAVLLVPSNSSTQEIFYAFGTSNAVTATTSSTPLPSGGICLINGSANTYIAAITASSTATLRVIQYPTCPVSWNTVGGSITATFNAPPNDVKTGPTALTAPGTVTVNSQGSGSVGIQMTGTGAGLAATFQGTVDGTNYGTIVCYTDDTTGTPVTTASANGVWRCPAAGLTSVRVNLTAISSGTENITTNASAGSANQPVGTQGSNTNLTGVAGHSISGYDPCIYQAKSNVAISTASGTTALVTGVSSKKVYICSLFLIAPTAVSVSIAEGSDSTCGTSNQAALIGVATNGTAANGVALAANGGFTLGNGEGTVAKSATNANYVCLFQSGTAQIAGNLTYVQQ